MTTRKTAAQRRAEAETDADPTGAETDAPPEESGQETSTPIEEENPDYDGGKDGIHLTKPRTGDDVVSDDYPPRPFEEAVTDTQRQALEDAGQWPVTEENA